MGMTQGWLALALMATGAAAASPEKPEPEITYTFRMVEARGLAWREPAGGLRPVVQHSAVSVWTAPADFLETLSERASGVVTSEAEVKGPALGPAHLTTRKNQEFVTKVSWRGEGKEPRRVVENVREGMVATVVGRKIDQGVLAQLVIEDTDIRSVHTIEQPAPRRAARTARADAKPRSGEIAAGKICEVMVTASMEPRAEADSDVRVAEHREEYQLGSLSSAATAVARRVDAGACCAAKSTASRPKADEQAARTAWAPVETAQIQIPEIGRAQAAGEWLIPDDGVLIIGFGPHTVADAEGRAIVRERLAIISAEVADDEAEAAVEDAVGEATDQVEVEDAGDPVPPPPAPAAEPAPLAPEFQPILPVPPRTATAIPALPSRTLPQGIHADGRPATLPPLPEEAEAELPAPASDESEPLPSPQTQRQPIPPPEPVAPASDSEAPADDEAKETSEAGEPDETTRQAPAARRKTLDPDAGTASFVLPAAFSAITSLSAMKPAKSALSAPFQGAHFLVPLKPLSIKLPLEQKLEFELVGRIVADDQPEIESRMVAGN